MSRNLMRMRGLVRCVPLAALAIATASCGDVVRSGRSPVMLTIVSLWAPKDASNSNTLSSSVSTGSDIAEAQLGVVMKNTDPLIAPTTNNQVTVNRYHVSYRRADGRNTAGLDVPYGFDGAVTTTIAAGTPGTVDFELVRSTAKRETPLIQLKFSSTVITTIADVTFYGQDQVGNEVSATGSILIDFGS